ncbi:nucleic acid-binding, OB-fold, replication protein A, OB domain protein [Tanacetum coccineum]
MIKELTSLQDDWCIKVRIIRLWKLMAFKNPLETWKIEMVLQDEEENKIVATVKESICPKFEKYLEEGKCFYISTFSVGDSEGTPRIVENKNKIHFYKATDVTPCDSYNGSVQGFRFKSFDTLLQEENQSSVSYDLIGDLISCGTIAHATVDGNRRPFIRLELEDLTELSNRISTNDIRDIGKAMSCVVVATVKKIERESDWWYLACVKCNHKANQDTVTEKDEYGVIVKKRIVFMCTNKACGQDTDVEYKQAHPIIDKSAAELLQEAMLYNLKETWTFSPLTLTNSLKKPMLSKLISKISTLKMTSICMEIQSNSQIIALELVSQPASSFMSPPSGSKHAKVRIPYMISSVIQCPRLYIEANTSKESVVL